MPNRAARFERTAVSVGWLLCLFAVASVKADAPSRTVTIEGMKFQPESLTVHVGEQVRWINKDLFPHTVTAENGVDSKEIAANATWVYRAKKAGEIHYHCTLHPTMTGLLNVQ